ncbi:MAG: DSD1 family PLP-dependent enzyme [Bosea sp.]|uniref:DSD1 family PLP-dependent enzyme n=1 Tax=unclassified Bosea (in: a-proteobacteria) TaxID=2653178 RepID=UPI0009595F27|nr:MULTISPECIES: DSD1 family PLP-dependent enzyme [unclassified Bosea (in: a-proteobacteria)]MBN9445134.1 DSD1 family PLP-dependent enzyme [Bosea sp. (in: a-proteobacteria)]MBN9455727.1 DSD1 family PLP-dependent enzyme [Bosea sp. (in: a-proteobacteria)]OJV07997.1 MAG: alanine racemase [Bosea sp. 67-29]
MPSTPPAQPGQSFAEIDTPALVLDLDAFERNLVAMAAFSEAHGIRLRPHAKTHKSPEIALRQIAHGAVGQCCQKVSEAEILVAGGVGDVLVTNEIASPAKLDRLAVLARTARIGLCVDHPDGVREAAEAAARHDVVFDVMVEIDVGGRRCGVAPGEAAVRVAEAVARSNTLRFAGLQAYHGSAQHMRSIDERSEAIERAGLAARNTAERLAQAGLECPIISGAGTGTFELETQSGIWNELQCGSYIFMDADYARNRQADGSPFRSFEHALFVLAGVMSKPVPDRAIVDAGHKSASVDSGMPVPFQREGAIYTKPSDEHGILTGDPIALPHRGERVLLVPGHCDPTVNLHDWYVCVRGLHGPDAHVEALWPVAARGAVT